MIDQAKRCDYVQKLEKKRETFKTLEWKPKKKKYQHINIGG